MTESLPDESLASFSAHWHLDPQVTFLNHGSFGACPTPVLEYQHQLRERMERQPVQFFIQELAGLMDESRAALASFVGADPENVAFVTNVTEAINAVVRSLHFEPGDELLTTDHEYHACTNVLKFAADRSGARVVIAEVPFPVESPDAVVEAVMEKVSDRTRLAHIDHITSQTGLVFPIERLVAEFEARGVDTLVDGAHAPGMVALDMASIGAAYYTGNCHKWVCAPKGAGFLHVRPDKQTGIHPTCISHGYDTERTDRSQFQAEFGWTGTDDPTPFLCVPEAIRFMGSLVPGGWPEVRSRNRTLALQGRSIVCEALGMDPPCPEELVGSLAVVPLPDGAPDETITPLYDSPLKDALLGRYGIEVPVIPWPACPQRVVRISAQLYNRLEHYELLARALHELLF